MLPLVGWRPGLTTRSAGNKDSIKLCVNCDTQNLPDAVFSEWGMSLRGAPVGDAALRLKEKAKRAGSLAEDEGATGGQLRDAGLLLAWTWGGCSLLLYSCEVSAILAMNPRLPALLFFVTYAGVPILLPWVTVFVARRWQFIGALMLIAGGILNLLWTYAEVAYPDSMRCLIIPLLIVVPAWAAAALLLYSYPPSTDPRGMATDKWPLRSG